MAITINSAAPSNAMPSAPFRAHRLNVDLDASYPIGGYDVSDQLEGGTVVWAETVKDTNGTAARFFKISDGGLLQSFDASAEDTPGAETSDATDLSGYTSLEIAAFTE